MSSVNTSAFDLIILDERRALALSESNIIKSTARVLAVLRRYYGDPKEAEGRNPVTELCEAKRRT